MAEEGWRTNRARHNALKRYRQDDDPELLNARRDLRAARLADYIKETVEAAPPLSTEQRERLAGLLRGGPDAAA